MYFENTGRENTEKTVELAVNTARERGIRHIVVASNSGYTAGLLKDADDLEAVCVTHVNGFVQPGQNEMPEDVRRQLMESGIKVLTTTHVLSGAERAMSRKFGGTYPVEIMAHTLRMLGQGVKVCVEIAVMALDAGLIPYGQPVIAIGGTGRGADTAVILTPSHASSILDTRIHEIICKPYL
ncbi:MAG: hypothetical protein GX041_00580 [Clostridiales bacterium]|jgi:hypothetical protein|nr:hypothetical protein [Clostridiales bacterium]